MFKLELSKEIKIHLIFYILFLKPADLETSVQDKLLKLLSENKYKIESIRDYDLETH